MSLTVRQDRLLDNATPVLEPADMDRIRLVADHILIHWARDDRWRMYEEYCSITDPEEVLVLWGMLRHHSKVRSAIKDMKALENGDGS